jgi:tRNA A37 threonylcarbamoyladenosine synthetase subunit TsaC/SUA5/YrdC
MIDEIGVPIVSTSANVSGQPHMLSGEEIYSVFIDKQYRPDLIIDAGIAENTRPSRLVSLLDGSVPLVIRE